MFSFPISQIFTEFPKLKQKVISFHPVKSAKIVAALLTEPDVHQFTLRIELLLHLLLAYGKGTKTPKEHEVSNWLNNEIGHSSISRICLFWVQNP